MFRNLLSNYHIDLFQIWAFYKYLSCTFLLFKYNSSIIFFHFLWICVLLRECELCWKLPCFKSSVCEQYSEAFASRNQEETKKKHARGRMLFSLLYFSCGMYILSSSPSSVSPHILRVFAAYLSSRFFTSGTGVTDTRTIEDVGFFSPPFFWFGKKHSNFSNSLRHFDRLILFKYVKDDSFFFINDVAMYLISLFFFVVAVRSLR